MDYLMGLELFGLLEQLGLLVLLGLLAKLGLVGLLGLLALVDLIIKLNRWVVRLVRFAYRAVRQWVESKIKRPIKTA